MQARAIFEAAATMHDQGVTVIPEIMVPLVGTPQVCIHFIYSCNIIKKVLELFKNKTFFKMIGIGSPS